MANRRMFSSRVTESTRFIKMPATSQNLYFHLGMNADDDGVVEAYPVMCMIGATEDDLRILVAKQFATVLNDDYVTFLNDWLENNNIRADRKVDSIYKDLLLQIVPDAKLRESKSTYYSRIKGICQTNDRQEADKCQRNVGIGKVRLGKDSIVQDSINTICSEPEAAPSRSGILIPLNDKSFYDVPLDKIAVWKDTYPAVDVEQELKKMAAWSHSNPTKRKTRRGIDRFINGWLSKEQDRGGNGNIRQQSPQKTEGDRYAVYSEMYKGLKPLPEDEDPFRQGGDT